MGRLRLERPNCVSVSRKKTDEVWDVRSLSLGFLLIQRNIVSHFGDDVWLIALYGLSKEGDQL